MQSSASVRFTGSATRLPDSVALLLGVLLYESNVAWTASNEFRLIAKQILRDLWTAAKTIHEGETK